MPLSRSWRPFAAAFLLSLAPALHAVDPPPSVTVTDLRGKPFPLDSLRGQPVLLDFWASWCGPCRKSFPALDRIQEKFKAQGLRVVGISLDESLEAVNTFLERVPVKFTVLRDAEGKSAEAFGVVAMPTSFLLDGEGRVVARFEGGEHLAEEEAAVAKLLGGSGAVKDVRVAGSLQATGSLKAWRRGHLAEPMMNLDGDPLTRLMLDHIHSSKEASAGNGGASGGGCGCN